MTGSLAEFRKRARETQRGMAPHVKIHHATIACYERGYCQPSLAAAKRIAEFLTARLHQLGVLPETEKIGIDDITFAGGTKSYVRARAVRCGDGQAA